MKGSDLLHLLIIILNYVSRLRPIKEKLSFITTDIKFTSVNHQFSLSNVEILLQEC